jgi:AMP phosphorylase
MRLTVKDMDIATGGVQVVILNQDDARDFDLHHEDRLLVRKGRKETTAILDIAESPKAVPRGRIGIFEEVLDALNAKEGDEVEFTLGDKPKSLACIKKKLDGAQLTAAEIKQIVTDITENRLSDVELTSYVTANYANGMSMREIVDLTKAMAATGDRIRPKAKIVADLHCIGGVPGNRTTMIVVPILVAAGLTVPKTASRAITSPAGTADTMEVLASVAIDKKRLERILDEVGGFIVWGGAVNLAPADDKIIRVEHPLSIDAEGQMLASIMAKKAVVGATHLLMDLPVGPGSKLPNRAEALHLHRHFDDLGKILGIKMSPMARSRSAMASDRRSRQKIAFGFSRTTRAALKICGARALILPGGCWSSPMSRCLARAMPWQWTSCVPDEPMTR